MCHHIINTKTWEIRGCCKFKFVWLHVNFRAFQFSRFFISTYIVLSCFYNNKRRRPVGFGGAAQNFIIYDEHWEKFSTKTKGSFIYSRKSRELLWLCPKTQLNLVVPLNTFHVSLHLVVSISHRQSKPFVLGYYCFCPAIC